MAKKNELPAITVRLDKELDTFLEEFARKHGMSKSGVLVHLARELYEQEQEREMSLNLKQVEYELKRKALEAVFDGPLCSEGVSTFVV